MFPDIEKVLAELLAAEFLPSADHAGSSTPADLGSLLPFCQVVRYGGFDDGVTDEAAVDVDWFAATRAEAMTLARNGHQFLIAGRHGASEHALIDRVTTSVGPVERPRVGSTGRMAGSYTGIIRRFGGSYTVSARRSPVTP